MTPAEAEIARVVKADTGRVLAALIAQLRDFDLAEEALQEAVAAAVRTWPARGVPENGAAWLLSVARRKALDGLRRRAVRSSEAARFTLTQLAEEIEEVPEYQHDIPDERLRLIFTCCHPALAGEAQVALTLKTLCGLDVRQIARAFIVAESTMAQRLTRAKAKIRAAGIAYRVPERADMADRLAAVLAVIYLIYTESHAASSGDDLTRPDLAEEALRLAEILHHLLPLPETAGLLALLLLHDARRPARTNADGAMIPLEAHDRAMWDRAKIARGRDMLHRALAARRPGPYQIQAAISALHAEATRWGDTDWPQIAGLYAALYALRPSPVVALNRAVAQSYAGNPAAALAAIDALADDLAAYQPYFAARADILARLGRLEGARADYERAIALSDNRAEQAFLRGKLARLLN